MKYIGIVAILLFAVSCSEPPSEEDDWTPPKKTGEKKRPEFSYKLTFTENVGWGYQLYFGADLRIDQKHIPSVSGIHGFETKEQAEIAAKYIMERMKAGEDHPSVSPEILDSIGAIDLETLNEPVSE